MNNRTLNVRKGHWDYIPKSPPLLAETKWPHSVF